MNERKRTHECNPFGVEIFKKVKWDKKNIGFIPSILSRKEMGHGRERKRSNKARKKNT